MPEYMTPQDCDKKHGLMYEKLDAIKDELGQIRLDVANVGGEVKRMDSRINGQIDSFREYRDTGKYWRGVVVAIVIKLLALAGFCIFSYTNLANMVHNNAIHIEEVISD